MLVRVLDLGLAGLVDSFQFLFWTKNERNPTGALIVPLAPVLLRCSNSRDRKPRQTRRSCQAPLRFHMQLRALFRQSEILRSAMEQDRYRKQAQRIRTVRRTFGYLIVVALYEEHPTMSCQLCKSN